MSKTNFAVDIDDIVYKNINIDINIYKMQDHIEVDIDDIDIDDIDNIIHKMTISTDNVKLLNQHDIDNSIDKYVKCLNMKTYEKSLHNYGF